MDLEPTTITCPRCGRHALARFYGPCDECRAALCQTVRLEVGPAADGAATGAGGPDTRFEPKMNVVPNQVAMKE